MLSFCWLAIFIVLLLLEICTVNLVSIWFAVGAFATFFISMFTNNIIIQLISFLVISCVVLFVTKPIAKKIKVKNIMTNLDRVVGMDAVVTQDISKFKLGEVKVDGKTWSAKGDETILKDSIVEVLKIDGVKLVVRKKES